jgi:SAM-dependent methyltransferase
VTSSRPGAITVDGCAVEVYTRLPAQGEPDIVHAALPAGAAVLDLGSGAGRIAHGLIALGHPVVAVDESAEMLAHVQGARTVRATIAELDLGETFPGVLLASHLVEVCEPDERAAILDTARRHLAPAVE